jgi:hypothetical protein
MENPFSDVTKTPNTSAVIIGTNFSASSKFQKNVSLNL